LDESNASTVVLATELLDNLPHDKIRHNRIDGHFEQAQVRQNDVGELVEVFVEMEDALLLDMLNTAPSLRATHLGRITWVPSVAFGILKHISKARPNSTVALLDFDYLPPPDLIPSKTKRRSKWATGEPIVTCMDGTDHECYLNAPPFCDVLFPTDFLALAMLSKRIWGSNAVVSTMKQSEFLERYGAEEVNATKSWLTGYSPLIHDFGNCSALTITTKQEDRKQ
jgi:hypothetical protein